MSGFFVVLSLDGRPVTETIARAHVAAVARRGDREPRLRLGPGVALGHANLPTTPEAEGEDLPAADPTGRYWITWDGRIDNRTELAGALDLEPIAARRMTDADYVLTAYAHWGDLCVEHLLGDWAFVIWDAHARRLFCAKDPLGWRQCYFARHDGFLLLGSEPEQLFAGGHLPRAINQEYLLRYLGMAFQEPGETCYAGVYQLEGGQSLVVTETALSVRSYRRQPPVERCPYRQPEEYVDEFVAVFREATAARLRSNRPIGVYLSGGLDSSYVAAVAAGEGADITAVTGYAPGTRYMDERCHARTVTEHLGIDAVEVDVGDCWSLSSHRLPDAIFDEPGHQLQSATQLRLGTASRDAGLGVMLGGEGGDEWLTGDDGYLADAVLRGRLGHAWRMARQSRPAGNALRAILHNCYRDLAPSIFQDSVDHLRGRDLGIGCSPIVEPNPTWTSIASAMRSVPRSRARSVAMTWRLYREIAGPAVSWRDRHAFAPNGVELRTPFNDRRVVELMAATPDWIKWHNGRPKDLLRDAEYRFLPRTIPDRTDRGIYRELMQAGVFEQERERVTQAIDAVLGIEGVRRDRALAEISRWRERRHHWWQPSWRLITAGLWLRAVDTPRSAAPVAPLTWSRDREMEGIIR